MDALPPAVWSFLVGLGRLFYVIDPRTKLTNAWFDARLGTTSTCRNWRTVLTLVAMTQR